MEIKLTGAREDPDIFDGEETGEGGGFGEGEGARSTSRPDRC